MSQQRTHGESTPARVIPRAKRETILAKKVDTQLLLDPADTAHDLPRPKPSLRVLIVDDHHDTADSLRMVLQNLGHDAIAVYSGPEALEVVGAFQPQAILLDIAMPGMDGFAVARQLRARDEGRRVTLIAASGYSSPQDKVQAREAGFDYHLTKPFEPDQLEQLLAIAR